MFETIDNRRKLLGEDLKVELREGSKVRIAASCFSMYAFAELKEELEKINELKFLFTAPTFTKDQLSEGVKKEKREFFIPKRNRENSLYGSEFEIKLRNEMTLKAIAKECAKWVKEKVKFKSNITNSSIPNLIGIENKDKTTLTYNPIDGFTTTDLGFQQGNSIFTAINKTDFAEQSKYLFSMFDEIWNDKSKVEDITETIVEMIGSAYQENAPEFIYYVILYNIFTEFLNDITEDNMPNEASIPNTFHRKFDIILTKTCFQNPSLDFSFFSFTSNLISAFSIKFAFFILLLSPILVPITFFLLIFEKGYF